MSELALFLSAFLAATILPLSSEVAFIASLASSMNPYSAIFYASCGNVLAITLNYWLGYWLYEKTKIKLNSTKTGIKSLKYGERYGYFILLFSWLPIIGDPLTLVAGVLRLKFVWFVIVAGGLRIARYYLLTLVV